MKNFKKKTKIINIMLVVIILLTNILPVGFNLSQALASEVSIQYNGSITYGLSTVGDFTVDGKQAFCIDHDKISPSNSTATIEIYNNENIAKCLYYGWNGEKQWSGFTSRAMGIVVTSLALDYFNNGNSHAIASDFIEYVNSVSMPEIVLSFDENNLTAYVEDGMQRTESVTVTGDSEYFLTIDLQSNVTLVNETKGTEETGSVNVYGGDTFYLKAPLSVNGTWTSNNINNCKYEFQPIIYRTASSSEQDLAGGLSVQVDSSTYINLTVSWLELGNIVIEKIDDEYPDIKISDTTFVLKDSEGNELETQTTDTNGIIEFSDILAGDYIIQEVSSNENYISNEDSVSITVEAGQTVKETITNEHKKGNLKVYKVDSDNNKIVLGNVEFQLYSYEFDEIIGTYYTDVNGVLEINNLRTGDYAIIETSTNQWYNLADSVDIEIEWDEETTATIENELKKGQIKVIKVDKDNNEVLLEGVTFEVLDSDGNVLETITTDSNGEAVTSEYAVRDFESLTLRETETLENYVLAEETQTIELEENEITTLIFENEKIKGQVEITKISADDNELTGEKKGTSLANAVFEIYTENDELVETITTNEEGKAISGLLEYGHYYIKEVDSGSEEYLLNTEKFEFDITENKEIIPMTIENTSVYIGLEIDKTGVVQAQANDEIKYSFNTLKNTSNVALDNFTWTDNLPYEYVRITKLFTGTYNEDLDYIVKYKTNKSEDYIEYGTYNTKTNNYIDFTILELDDDEYITDFKIEFGTVMAGFEAEEKPFIFAKVLPTVTGEDKWTNYTTLAGNYNEYKIEDKAEWTTISYEKNLTINKLPRTGF